MTNDQQNFIETWGYFKDQIRAGRHHWENDCVNVWEIPLTDRDKDLLGIDPKFNRVRLFDDGTHEYVYFEPDCY